MPIILDCVVTINYLLLNYKLSLDYITASFDFILHLCPLIYYIYNYITAKAFISYKCRIVTLSYFTDDHNRYKCFDIY